MPTLRPRRSVTLDDEVWSAVLELAAEKRTNASEIMRLAIIAYLEQHGWEVAIPDSGHLTRQKVKTDAPA